MLKYVLKVLNFFNNNCFESCSKGNDYLHFSSGEQIIENVGSNECKCEGYWRYNGKNEKECVKSNENEICIVGEDTTNYLLINDTKECYYGSECRKESPKLFNRKCYKECPTNSNDLQGIVNSCKCVNFWYDIKKS